MAKSIPEDRVPDLIRQATRVFIAKGFRRTQVSDVAKALGVSAGSVYTYVDSKEALFYWCLRRAAGGSLDEAGLPLPTVAHEVMLKEVEQALDAGSRLPSLKAALKRRPAGETAPELARIIGEIYDATHQTRFLQALIERSAMDIEGLADTFFVRIRRQVLNDLTRYLEARSSTGAIRELEHPAVSARLILETQSWFARNRYGDPDAGDITDEAARTIVIDHLVRGLLP